MICSRVTDRETDAGEDSGACPGSAVQLVEGLRLWTPDLLSGLPPLAPHTLPGDGAEWREMDPTGEAPGSLVRPDTEVLSPANPRLHRPSLAVALIRSCPGRQTYCILGPSEDALVSQRAHQ